MMTTNDWAIGQRVRNEAEPSLGLGIVAGFPNPRTLEVDFPGAGERRLYNPKSAPLRRYVLGVGQQGVTRDGRHFRVERVEEDGAGCLTSFPHPLQRWLVPRGSTWMSKRPALSALYASLEKKPDHPAS